MFLVVCNHRKDTVSARDVLEARAECLCKKCKVLDRVARKWVYRDVRVYAETQDIHAVTSAVRPQKEAVDQLDWVGPL